MTGALDLLAREGVTAIRIPRLCEELGVTKQLLLHFDDLEQLMAAMADRWGDMQSEAVRALAALDSIPVESRIEQMAAMLVDPKHWMVEASVGSGHAPTTRWRRRSGRWISASSGPCRRPCSIWVSSRSRRACARARWCIWGSWLIHGRDNLPTPTPEEVQAVIDLLARP
ncbi:hypothetical protein [Nocardia africana]|uniref:hypothetical protein n=1 Tax=Nocardia africana TaxID=134964 RepID=UPI001D140709|nr:hypothetical protein [Nocardia africana]MCC3316673.1 hypothetical protein [Nocardia africana]